jgi:glycosyltransferase involved in cell wall biosynthesis
MGGVNILTRALYRMLEGWGWEPTIVYAVNAGPEVSFVERLRFTLRYWRADSVPYPHAPDPYAGLRTQLVAAAPVPYWLFYLVPQFILGPVLADYDMYIVTGGPAHCAVPLALRGVPYILWVGTDYEDELLGKIQANDDWAQAVLRGRSWPILVAQERYALRNARIVLAQSDHTARLLSKRFPTVASSIRMVLFPVDTSRFKPPSGPSPTLPYGQFLLSVTRPNDPRKNVSLLLEAFARVQQVHPNLKLVVVGGSPTDQLLEQSLRLGLQEKVHFIEKRLSRDELVLHYQGAELFVLSSTQEGLGIAVLEAIACGTPVVSTDCGGPSGVVKAGQTGLLVGNNDPDALANGVLQVLDDPTKLERLRDSCARFAQQNFSEELVSAQVKIAFQEMYGELLPHENRLLVPDSASEKADTE